jgi:hypothetical protein
MANLCRPKNIRLPALYKILIVSLSLSLSHGQHTERISQVTPREHSTAGLAAIGLNQRGPHGFRSGRSRPRALREVQPSPAGLKQARQAWRGGPHAQPAITETPCPGLDRTTARRSSSPTPTGAAILWRLPNRKAGLPMLGSLGQGSAGTHPGLGTETAQGAPRSQLERQPAEPRPPSRASPANPHAEPREETTPKPNEWHARAAPVGPDP